MCFWGHFICQYKTDFWDHCSRGNVSPCYSFFSMSHGAPVAHIKSKAGSSSQVRLPRGPWRREEGPQLQYQNIDGLIDGPFRHDVLNPRLIHIGGPPVLEDGACHMEVLRAVHLVGAIEEEVSCLICHSCKTKLIQTLLSRSDACLIDCPVIGHGKKKIEDKVNCVVFSLL